MRTTAADGALTRAPLGAVPPGPLAASAGAPALAMPASADSSSPAATGIVLGRLPRLTSPERSGACEVARRPWTLRTRRAQAILRPGGLLAPAKAGRPGGRVERALGQPGRRDRQVVAGRRDVVGRVGVEQRGQI